MKNYLEETLHNQLKVYRDYESSIEKQWGGKKRLSIERFNKELGDMMVLPINKVESDG